eukprot:TRINITY_DN2129_c0_g2_i1.p1 TRINITY_DN2129_c0_g2~~TRINITY_DN2129_c0_g2_i1.p1  ORF type:complete len:899 (-),score=254.91 TRINITY_DN2129_c0_g2_i1:53-2749(-)
MRAYNVPLVAEVQTVGNKAVSQAFGNAFEKGAAASRDSYCVEGAGFQPVNGTYMRTGDRCNGCEVYRKRCTSYGLLRCGDEGWSVVDFGGSQRGRWSLYTLELYRCICTPAPQEPPLVGWVPIDGKMPGPILRRPLPEECNEAMVQTAVPLRTKGDLLMRMGALVAATPSKPKLRPEQKVPQEPEQRRNFDYTMAGLGLPELPKTPPAGPRVPGASKEQLLIFSVVLWRPSALAGWGCEWNMAAFREKGAKVLSGISPKSPLSRWNVWQHIRGRHDLIVRQGDRLLKVDGIWNSVEDELGKQEGTVGKQAVEAAGGGGGAGGETQGTILLEFARPVRRPVIVDRAPTLTQEVDGSLTILWESDVRNVRGWAVCLQDLTSERWYTIDGATGEPEIFAAGREVAAFDPEVIDLTLPEGVMPDRPMIACVAMLLDTGWSVFSEASPPMTLTNTGIFKNVPRDWDYRLSREKVDRPRFILPVNIVPGYSAPIPLVQGPRDFQGRRRRIRLRVEVPGDAIHGLGLAAYQDDQALMVTGVEHKSALAVWNEVQARTRSSCFHGARVSPNLQQGDLIVCVNGTFGADVMAEEIQRPQALLSIRLERVFGGVTVVDAVKSHLDDDEGVQVEGEFRKRNTVPGEEGIFAFTPDLDQEMSALAEEVRSCVMMEKEEGKLACALTEMNEESLTTLLGDAAAKAQWAPRTVAQRYYLGVIKMGERMLPMLRQRRENLSFMPDGEVTLALKRTCADLSQDPTVVAGALTTYKEVVTQAVQDSQLGEEMVSRAEALQAIWEWRQTCASKSSTLMRAIKDALEREFKEEGASEDSEEDEDDDEQFASPYEKELKKLLDLNVLTEALKECEDFAHWLRLDLNEGKAILQRHKEKNQKLRADVEFKQQMALKRFR